MSLLRYARNDRKSQIFVSGSIARDLIMDFPGRFADFIDPKKIHVLNLSFAVENLKENIGGTAANICYNLAMLGEHPEVIGNIGYDQKYLLRYMRDLGIGVKNVKVSRTKRTAAAYIITDKDDNQIAGFHAGAMSEQSYAPKVSASDWAIIAAEDTKNMVRLARHYQRNQVNYIFDPGQQITLSKSDLQTCIRGAAVLIGNDYEIGLIMKKIDRKNSPFPSLIKEGSRGEFSSIVIRTLGPKGSEILASNRKIRIGIAKPRRVLDPTGAGDAYRAGLLKGLILGYNLRACGQLGATVASFAVEEYGTQNHRFTWNKVIHRFRKNFGSLSE